MSALTLPAVVTTLCGVSFAQAEFTTILLTPCCKASGKGGGSGVVCRKCYRDVDGVYGDCAVNDEPGRVREFVLDFIEEAGCPCASDCADLTVSALAERPLTEEVTS